MYDDRWMERLGLEPTHFERAIAVAAAPFAFFGMAFFKSILSALFGGGLDDGTYS